MMKKISVLVLSLLAVGVAAQAAGEKKQRIAVYVTGGKTETDNDVLTSNLKSAITASQSYEAVERTTEFLRQLRKEQSYQHASGNVDDNDIARLGKEAGVQYVCVAELVPVPGGDFVTARLIDVEKASVVASADGADKITDLPSLMSMSKSIAAQLIQNASYRYTGIAKKRVAVYVSGADREGTNKVLGVKLVSAITKSSRYAAMERTDAFLRQLGKEQSYQQRSGNVDDNQLARLGKQLGVQYVCAAKVGESSYGGKFLDVSLINVETAVVTATANGALTGSDITSLMSITQSIAVQLLTNADGDLSIEQVDEAPKWFFRPPSGLHVGVSLPFKNQEMAVQQATYAALIAYMLQLDCEGVFESTTRGYYENSASTQSASKTDYFGKISLQLPTGYEVEQMAKNRYGEVFVALRVPANAAKKIAMVASSSRSLVATGKSSSSTFQLQLIFEDGGYQFYLKASGSEEDVEVAASMSPGGLYDTPEKANYSYTSTCRRPAGVAIANFQQMQPLKPSLGLAYLTALLGIFEEEAGSVDVTEVSRNEPDDATPSANAASSLSKHRATFISEKCIIDNVLYIKTYQP
jgi:TolB-like protein